MKYAWIARHKNHWPVSLACDVLGVSTSGFFESIRRQGSEQPSRPGANKRISSEALLAHMGRPAGWMQKLTGRGAMRSPGAPSLRREVERQFWEQIATGRTSERAAEVVGVS